MELSISQIAALRQINAKYPEPATVAEGDHLSELRDADLIDQYDMWPDGTRRWTITRAGRKALEDNDG